MNPRHSDIQTMKFLDQARIPAIHMIKQNQILFPDCTQGKIVFYFKILNYLKKNFCSESQRSSVVGLGKWFTEKDS